MYEQDRLLGIVYICTYVYKNVLYMHILYMYIYIYINAVIIEIR